MSNALRIPGRCPRAWWLSAVPLVLAAVLLVLLLVRHRHVDPGPPVRAESAESAGALRTRADWWPDAHAGVASVFPGGAVAVAAASAPGRAVDDPAALRAMVLSGEVPVGLRAEAASRLCTVTTGNGFGAWVGPLLREAMLPDFLHAALLHGLREQELPVTAAGMLAVADTPQHPRADEARFWLVNVLGLPSLPADESARRRAVARAVGQALPRF